VKKTPDITTACFWHKRERSGEKKQCNGWFTDTFLFWLLM